MGSTSPNWVNINFTTAFEKFSLYDIGVIHPKMNILALFSHPHGTFSAVLELDRSGRYKLLYWFFKKIHHMGLKRKQSFIFG